jgi:hypothetical protein
VRVTVLSAGAELARSNCAVCGMKDDTAGGVNWFVICG